MTSARALAIGALALLTGCAFKRPPPITVPVRVGCGPMPPPPDLCLETLPPNATDGEVIKCYAETAAALITDDRAIRLQYAPCAIPASPGVP